MPGKNKQLMKPAAAASSSSRKASLLFSTRLNVFGVGLGALWITLNTIILPERVADVTSSATKGTALGVVSLIGIGGAALFQPIAGFLSDRSQLSDRRQPYIVGGAAVVVLGIGGFGLAGNLILLLLAYPLMQLASNAAQAAFQALIPDLVPADGRGLASGVKNALNVVGIGIGLIASQLVLSATDSIGLTLTFLALVLIGSAALDLWWVPSVPPKSPDRRADQVSAIERLRSLMTSSAEAFRSDRTFANAILAQFFFLLGIYPVQRFLVYFVEGRFGIDNIGVNAGAYLAGAAVLGIIAALLSGHLSDDLGRVPILRGSVLIAALGILGVAVLPTLLTTAIAGVLVVIGIGSFMAVNWALISESIPDGKGAQYFALANIATAGASALAGLFGPLADAVNAITPGNSYSIAFIIGAAISLTTLRPLYSESHQGR